MRFLIGFLIILTSSSLANAEDCLALPDKVESFIKSFTNTIRGAEYCEYRQVARGDVNLNGTEDLVVVFNVEGACHQDLEAPAGSCGNQHDSFLQVFLDKDLKEVPMVTIGSRGSRSIDGVSVEDGVILVKTLTRSEDDPMCCPSIEEKTRFILDKGRLIEKSY